MLNKQEIEKLKDFYRLHEGKTCWIIGNGPSLNQTNLLLLKGKTTFAVNAFITHKDFDQLLPTYYVATNPRLMKSDFLKDDLIPKLRKNDITCFLNSEAKPIIGYPYDNICYIETTESPLIVDAGYNLDITKCLHGTRVSVVIQAVIPIAVYMGFKQIFLVGCDNDYKDLSMEKAHFYGTAEHYPNLLQLNNTARNLYPDYFRKKEMTSRENSSCGNEEFSLVDHEVKKLGVKIYNCTAGGKLEVFPRLRFEDAARETFSDLIALHACSPCGITKCSVDQLLPPRHSITLSDTDKNVDYGEMPVQEREILCKIIKNQNPKAIFEIGTFQGSTTICLAANSDAVVYTLDLPPKGHMDYHPPAINDPTLDVYPERPGVKHFSSTYACRIRQLYGDTRSFDYSPYHGQMDIIFVDACHHYDFVLQDSMNAFHMIKPDGMIIWHDYAEYAPGVIKALETVSKIFPLTHIEGTSLVIYGKQPKNDEGCNRAQNTYPESPDLLSGEVTKKTGTENLQGKKLLLLERLKQSPDKVDLLVNLGIVDLHQGYRDSAAELLKYVLILDPHNKTLWENLSHFEKHYPRSHTLQSKSFRMTTKEASEKTCQLYSLHNVPKELRQSYYDHTKDPLSNIDYYRDIKERLISLGMTVEEKEIEIDDFNQWLNQFSEIKNHYRNHGDVFIEKCLEHYVTYRYLNIARSDIFIDIAASGSPWAEVLNCRGIRSYRLDMAYPQGLNGINIGTNACDSRLPDGFCSTLALHCAFECFMGDDDIRFLKEAERILKINGRCAIAPLYLEDTHFVSTSLLCDQQNIPIEKEALRVWRDDEYNVPFDRFYSPESFEQRIHSNIPENLDARIIYFNNIENLNKYYKGQRIYCFFMLYCEKKHNEG